MHIHILGICGTFMGGLALLAKKMGHTVTGSDHNVYPPMSTQLESQGIKLRQGYSEANLELKPDLVVIGNALSRGNPEVEAVLNMGLPYMSGPQWFSEYVLKDRWVVAVAGTHGKTTTSSMVAWILEDAGMAPGFLIGGIPQNFGLSARLGNSSFFVVEADEYDTAFFDKRSKFVHYRPRTLVINNLEYDHADIFPDLASIQRQFHHLVRIVPGHGMIIRPARDQALDEVMAMGCWTPVQTTGVGDTLPENPPWRAALLKDDGSEFRVFFNGKALETVRWDLTGEHNVANALSAIAAAVHAGVTPARAVASLNTFRSVKRRMEVRASKNGMTLYDDFAHHPTAIATTLAGLRAQVGQQRILAILEPRSNTMRLGTHADQLARSLALADQSLIYQPPELNWDLAQVAAQADNIRIETSIDSILAWLGSNCRKGDHIIIMSNGGFGGIHEKAIKLLNLA